MKTSILLLVLGISLYPDLSRAGAVCLEESSELREVASLLDVVEAKTNISFTSYIDKGSISRFLKKIDKEIEKNKGKKLVITISVNSGGGDINEAIRAVQYIRNLNNDPLIEINTKISSFSSCESACTILYTAGHKRLASERAEFGFHSPRYQSGKLSGLTRKEVEERFRQIWLRYVAMVDPVVAEEIESKGYLKHDRMSYLSARELKTGYVTEFL